MLLKGLLGSKGSIREHIGLKLGIIGGVLLNKEVFVNYLRSKSVRFGNDRVV